MKVAVSIPQEVFAKAERFVKESGRTRSEVYAAAVRDYVGRHDTDSVTEALDEVVDELATAQPETDFMREAARRRLRSVEW